MKSLWQKPFPAILKLVILWSTVDSSPSRSFSHIWKLLAYLLVSQNFMSSTVYCDELVFFCWQHTATKITFKYSFSGNSAASAPISTFMSVSELYSPRIGLYISSSRIRRPIVGIYKSLTDTWMWKLGLRPRYSLSGNICFEISVFCLCSARTPITEFLLTITYADNDDLPNTPNPT